MTDRLGEIPLKEHTIYLHYVGALFYIKHGIYYNVSKNEKNILAKIGNGHF